MDFKRVESWEALCGFDYCNEFAYLVGLCWTGDFNRPVSRIVVGKPDAASTLCICLVIVKAGSICVDAY